MQVLRETAAAAACAFVKRITFLGTSSAIPCPGKCNVSSTALTFTNGSVVLLDAGEATQHQIMRSKSIKMQKIEAILITHLHGDHFFGIFGLLASLSSMGRKDPVHVCGPIGLESSIRSVMGHSDTFLPYQLVIHEIDATLRAYKQIKNAKPHQSTQQSTKSDDIDRNFVDSKLSLTTEKDEHYSFEQKPYSFSLPLLPGIEFTAIPIEHRVPCVGYSIREPTRPGPLDGKRAMQLGAKGKQLGALKSGQDVQLDNGNIIRFADVVSEPIRGRSFAFLQDTNDAIFALPYIQDCDVLIHECTYDASMTAPAIPRGHSSTLIAAALAQEINAKTLILTHFSSRYTKEALVHDVEHNRVLFRAPKLNTEALEQISRYNVENYAKESETAIFNHRDFLRKALIAAGPLGSRAKDFVQYEYTEDGEPLLEFGDAAKNAETRDESKEPKVAKSTQPQVCTFYDGTPDKVSVLQLELEARMYLNSLQAGHTKAFIAADFRSFEPENFRDPNSPWIPLEEADVELDLLLVKTLQEVEEETIRTRESADILQQAKFAALQRLQEIENATGSPDSTPSQE